MATINDWKPPSQDPLPSSPFDDVMVDSLRRYELEVDNEARDRRIRAREVHPVPTLRDAALAFRATYRCFMLRIALKLLWQGRPEGSIDEPHTEMQKLMAAVNDIARLSRCDELSPRSSGLVASFLLLNWKKLETPLFSGTSEEVTTLLQMAENGVSSERHDTTPMDASQVPN